MTDDSRETVGNEKRAMWRKICRKRLAEHIFETLRIRVKPSDVRLKPPEGDRIYAWKVQSLYLRPLFKKHLSKHSVGAYMQLCEEIGSGFYAIFAEHQESNLTHDLISRLQDDNSKMLERIQLAEERYLQQSRIVSNAIIKIQEQESIIQEAQEKIQLQEAQIMQWIIYSESL
ncbi:Ferredoxin reductase-type FAD-binding domain [Penicillium digitatum]|uniref:Ferredoxin reductase-type FAD-binding domain n=1 Tax=Penicillium digitatum TaxID=36651 RepID=A0A7T6XN26_PENDI|nr:Ferredoxin reductase-type FAD-binding domain [Penicillium digitatum]